MTMIADTASSNTTKSNELTPLQEECWKIFQAKQFKSCEILARMDLSSAEQQGRDCRISWSLLGDCALEQKNYTEALNWYHRISSRSYRLKEATCLAQLGNVVEASSVLEMVVPSERTLTMNMTLANLYLASGRNHSAMECFFSALQQNPCTLEAVEWLAMLGAPMDQVLSVIVSPEIQALVKAIFAKHRNQLSSALSQFTALEQNFPNNVYLLLKIATLLVRSLYTVCTPSLPDLIFLTIL
jgi:tetratricopeptide (TPR) repeat protein